MIDCHRRCIRHGRSPQKRCARAKPFPKMRHRINHKCRRQLESPEGSGAFANRRFWLPAFFNFDLGFSESSKNVWANESVVFDFHRESTIFVHNYTRIPFLKSLPRFHVSPYDFSPLPCGFCRLFSTHKSCYFPWFHSFDYNTHTFFESQASSAPKQ